MDPTAASEEEDNRKAKTVRGILECSLELARELLASCDGDVNKVIDIFKDTKMTQESTGTAGGISSVLKRKMPFGFASDSYEENLDKDRPEKTKFKKIREYLSNYLVEVRKSVSKGKEEAMMKLEDCPLCSAPQILQDKTVLQYSCAECGAVTCRRCMQQAHGDRECEDKDMVDMECGEKNEEFKKINVFPSRHFDVDSELEREFRIAEGHFLRMLRMRKSYEIKSIDIVYNEKLKKKFDQKKQEFKMMGLDDQPLLIFHGTPQENIEHILRENFDLSKVANGRRYGNGVYFSEVPEVSMKYTKDQSSLILCLVLQGNNSKEIKIPQTGVQAIGALAIVVPDVDQILPKYVINFADKPEGKRIQPVLIPPGSLNLTTSSSASANTSNLASHLAYLAAGFPGPPVPAISAPPLSVPGFSAPPAPGFSAPPVPAPGFSIPPVPAPGFSIPPVPAPGFSAPPVPSHGFSVPPVPVPSFSAPPVPAPGFSVVPVPAHGFSAPPWPASGFSAPQVPAFLATSVPSPGFSASQVDGHGFSAPPISAPGFAAPSFPTHGFSAPQVPGPGFSLQCVPFPGFSAPLVSANGFSASPVSAPVFSVPASGPLPSQAANSKSSIAAQTSQPAPAALYAGQAGYLPNPMPSLTMASYNLVSQIVAQLSQAMSQISQTMSQVPSMPQAMSGMQQTMQQEVSGMQQTMQQAVSGMQPTVSQAVPGMQQISPQTVSLAMPGMQQLRGQVLQQQQSHVPGGQTAVIRQQLPQVPQNQAGVQRVVITPPGIRPGQPGSQITVPLATLQALKTGQGIPTGQPGHLLVKTETGQYQIVRVTPVTEPKSLPGQPSPSPAQATSSAASMAVPPLLPKSTKGKVGRPPKVRKNEKVNNKGDADACGTASGSVNLVNSQDLYCAVCNVKMSSKELIEEHKKEREHRMKERSSK